MTIPTFNFFRTDLYKPKILTIPANSQSSKDISVTIYYGGLADAVVDIIKNVITNEEFDLTIDGKISGNALFGLITVSQCFKSTQIYS